ncbi:Uncharacterised protein [uncultured archaeon]|nr:Uncharacterised protein [uncultured archaeon]
MNFSLKALAILAVILLLAGGAYACSISTSSFQTEVRGTGDYSTAITADNSTDIDIKISFTVDSYSGSDCPTNISAQSKVYRYNNDTSNWEYVRTTSSKSQELSNDTYVFVWNNEFNTGSNSKYTRYRIDGNILSGSTIVDSESAYIDVENNSCSGINLVANNFTINEGATSTRTLRVENNTNKEFSISTLSVLLSSPVIRSGSTSGYDNVVSSFSYEPVNLYLDAGFVSSNTTTTLKFQVAGYLGNNYCSISAIGTKNFDVTVQNTGTTDNYDDTYYDDYYDSYSSSSACADINLSASNTSMDESTEGKPVVNITNNSTKRFEILEVKTTDNGIDLSNYYNDKYVYPDQVSDIILRAISPSVTSDKVYTNTVWVRGVFSDGRSCSFDATGRTTFTTTVFDASATNSALSIPLNCSNFSISTMPSASIKNYGTIPFTINNSSGKRADVYIESTSGTTTTPTLISIPGASSISRDLAVNITAQNGQITFRPVIDGCSLASKSIAVTNTGEVVLAQGQNNASNTIGGALAGLFALGNNISGLGLVVLAIIIIIIIVGIVASNESKKSAQVWEKK